MKKIKSRIIATIMSAVLFLATLPASFYVSAATATPSDAEGIAEQDADISEDNDMDEEIELYAVGAGQSVTIKRSGGLTYQGVTCGNYSVNGMKAFCGQHNLKTPAGLTAELSVTSNQYIRKILYYGYGGPGQNASGNPLSGAGNAKGTVTTSLALNRYFAGTSYKTAEFNDFYNWAVSQPDILSGSEAVLKLGYNGSIYTGTVNIEKNDWFTSQKNNGYTYSQAVYLSGSSSNYITIPAFSDGYVYVYGENPNSNTSAAFKRMSAKGGKVKVYGGEYFQYVVPSSRTTAQYTGTFTGLTGYDAYVASTPSGYQDIYYLGAPVTSNVRYSINWTEDEPEYGYVTIHKTSADSNIAVGNDQYNLAGIQYGVYEADTDTLVYAFNLSFNGCAYAEGSAVNGVKDPYDSLKGSNHVVFKSSSDYAAYCEANPDYNLRTAYKKLPLGDYYVKETINPSTSGYATDTEKHYFSITKANSSPSVAVELSVTDKPVESGALSLKKVSANEDMTSGNGCYSLAGATFDVYLVNSMSQKTGGIYVGSFETNENGTGVVTDSIYGTSDSKAWLTGLPYGYYRIEETSPSKGYLANESIPNVQIKAGSNPAATVTVEETPGDDPLQIVINKIDAETGKVITDSEIGASLEGAEFTIKYYDGYYDSIDALPAEAARTWVIKTIYESGYDWYRARLDAEHLVSGDGFYYSVDGSVVIPLGTVTIEETSAPAGYNLVADGGYIETAAGIADGSVIIGQVRMNATAEGNNPDDVATILPASFYIGGVDQNTQEGPVYTFTTLQEEAIEIYEPLIRADIKFTKTSDTGETLSGIPFRLSLLDEAGNTVESHILVTDKNGVIDTAAITHSINTNANDEAEEYVSAGTWFYGISDSKEWKAEYINDEAGALVYGNYKLEELTCAANEPYILIEPIYFTVDGNETIDLGVIENNPVTMKTTASDTETGTHYSRIAEEISITDTVEMHGLKVGKEYTLNAKLMNAETGEPVKTSAGEVITATKTFVASETDCTVDVVFTFNAADCDLYNATTVVFEDLYHENVRVTTHADLTDKDQTIYFPGLHTKAFITDNGVLADEMSYSNFDPDACYTVKSQAVDHTTGEVLFAAEKIIYPESSDGIITIPLDGFDIEKYAGRTVTIYETVEQDGVLIIEEASLDNMEQTVTLPETPETPNTPKTGDSRAVASAAVILLLAVFAAVGVIIKKRRNA